MPILRNLFQARRAPDPAAARVPEGERVYAVGDIHGRLDLLERLLRLIEEDDAGREPARTSLIFLGDLVDRGPQSAGVVEQLMRLARERHGVRLLAGNHEELFLQSLDGDDKAIRVFCRVGGRETALSYGMGADEYERLDYVELQARLVELVPIAHRDFLAAFEALVVVGDYAFAHAGVRPGLALDQQREADLRWIRSPFLEHRGRLEKLVVHGHTIEAEVAFRAHRIGIDTGAYQTGHLTALGLEGGATWLLQT